jgi:hypothetical protein
VAIDAGCTDVLLAVEPEVAMVEATEVYAEGVAVIGEEVAAVNREEGAGCPALH